MPRYLSVLIFLPLSLSALPLRFELHQGQYSARGVTLTESGPVFATGVRMTLPGARWTPPLPDGPLSAYANYFLRASRPRVPQYDRVGYRDIYRGVDLIFHASGAGLEYDFVLAPGADPRVLHLRFPGVRVSLVAGDLLVGSQRHHRPLAYQETAAGKHYVEANYRLRAGGVTFDIGPYDSHLPLVIDPVLTYATFAGGSAAETGSGIAVDTAGNAYLAGSTDSPDFAPLKGVATSEVRGFVAKLDPTGANVLATAVIGGATIDGIALDSAANVIVTGAIAGAEFPGPTSGAFQRPSATGFVAKLTQDATGFKLAFISTFAATPAAVALDPLGAIYLAGSAGVNFQTTAGAVQTSNAGGSDAFALKLSGDGARLLYATYVGGRDEDAALAIAVNPGGEAYIAGQTASSDFRITAGAFQSKFGGRVAGENAAFGDAFVARLDAGGTNLLYSTYLGGVSPDIAWAIAVDKDGNAYVAGGTQSADFPVSAGVPQSKYAGGTPLRDGADPAGDAFIARFDVTGRRVWSTFLGGSGRDLAQAIALDAAGNVYVAGTSESADFPWTAGAIRGCRTGGPWVAQLDGAGTKLMRTSSTGGMGFDLANALALDSKGAVLLAGDTSSRPFFSTAAAAQKAYGGGDTDAFAAKLDWQTDGRVYVSCVLNAASFAAGNFAFFPQGTVAPGEVVSIFGGALGPEQPALAQPAAGAPYPTTLGGTQVFFDGIPSPMWYAGPNQINAVVPYGVKPPATQVTVQRSGFTDGPRTLPVAAAVPGIFAATGSGQGQAAVLNEDGSYNSAANPAPRGSVIVFYAVGAGTMLPAQRDGAVQPTTLPLPVPVGDVKVQIRGLDAKVLYGGAAPGYIAGLLQLNVQIPDTVGFGNSVPLTLTIGGQQSQANITIAVR
jgi:uncharacterized protein (TIGR03437 family)